MRRCLARLCEKDLKLPQDGGSGLGKPKVDPFSIAGRLDAKKTGAAEVLGKVPGVQRHLSEAEKVVMTGRDKTMTDRLSPENLLNDWRVKKAVKVATYQLESEERWALHQADVANAKDKPGEVPQDRQLCQVLARAGYFARSDKVPYQKGVVRVNGTIIRNPLHRCTPRDDIVLSTQRVMVDYPKIWRFSKPRKDRSFFTPRINATVDASRIKIKGMPAFAYSAGGILPMRASGLQLFTNDASLAEYINSSPDIERDWTCRVNGQMRPELIRRLNMGYTYNDVKYSNMEWVVTSVDYLGKVEKRHTDRAIVASHLKIRFWGPGPPIPRLLEQLGKECQKLERVKIGPYDLSHIHGEGAQEAYIDEGLLRFTDHAWAPWVDAHAPLLQQNITSRLQRNVLFRRSGAEGSDALEEELE
eukprot:gene12372-19136_t